MAAHTPGAWEYVELGSGDWAIRDRYVRHLALVYKSDAMEANARLIAAAPDMLEALKASNRTLIAERDVIYDSITNSAGEITDPADGEGLAEYNALIDANRAAIAKATDE